MADGSQIIEPGQGRELTGLERLRLPFAPHQIGKLPKPTKKQTDDVKQDFKKGIRCEICGAWHHPNVVHLDYVGHAALTDRLLDCDPAWNWEPLAFTDRGTPLLDENGGMWIKLTVCGVSRLGYGHADSKKGGDAAKEVIGDALRNAAMRFGAALDLWHKGDLHVDDEGPSEAPRPTPKPDDKPSVDPQGTARAAAARVKEYIDGTETVGECNLAGVQANHADDWGLLTEKTRAWMNERMENRRGTLAQKPPEKDAPGDAIELDDSVPF